MKYHLNKNTGKPNICRVKTKPCPLGENTPHYSTLEDAKKAEKLRQVRIAEELEKSLINEGVYQEDLLENAVKNKTLLSSDDYNRRQEYLENIHELFKLKKMGTIHQYSSMVNGERVFTEERSLLHESIITEYLEKYGYDNVLSDGKIFLTGGLSGSGKTFILNNYTKIDSSDYLLINSDPINYIFAERGLIPSVRGLTPMEASTLVHQESLHIMELIQNKASDMGKNMIFDLTMTNKFYPVKTIVSLKEKGYTDFRALFVNNTIENSAKNGFNRYKKGMDNYILGNNNIGGRYVPQGVLLSQVAKNPDYDSANAEVFAYLTHREFFVEPPHIFNNTDLQEPPELINPSVFIESYVKELPEVKE